MDTITLSIDLFHKIRLYAVGFGYGANFGSPIWLVDFNRFTAWMVEQDWEALDMSGTLRQKLIGGEIGWEIMGIPVRYTDASDYLLRLEVQDKDWSYTAFSDGTFEERYRGIVRKAV